MAKQTIQIADKPTLDETKALLENSEYGLEALQTLIDTINTNVGSISNTAIMGKINPVNVTYKMVAVNGGGSDSITIPGKIIPLVGYCIRQTNTSNSQYCNLNVIAKKSNSTTTKKFVTSADIGYYGDNQGSGLYPFIWNRRFNPGEASARKINYDGVYINFKGSGIVPITTYNSLGAEIAEDEYLEDLTINISNPGVAMYCYLYYIKLD